MPLTTHQPRPRTRQTSERPRGKLGDARELAGDRLQFIIADMNKALTA